MIIYQTTNLLNNKKYIGKDRLNNPNYLGGGVDLKKDIKILGKNNFQKEILECCLDLNHLKEREEYWLLLYDAKNNIGFYNKTNKSFGSDNGPTKTEKYLNRGKNISSARTGIKHIQKWNQSEATKENLRIKLKKPKTEEHKLNIKKSRELLDWDIIGKKISKGNLGQKRQTTSDKLFNNPLIMTPIIQYDLGGNFIKEWNGVSEAARFYNKDNAGFRAVAIGKQKTCAGYIWKYKTKE